MTFIVVSTALIMDYIFGEPKRYHPLVGFGNCAAMVERKLNKENSPLNAFMLGAFGVCLLILPLVIVSLMASKALGSYSWALAIIVLYWAIGLNSLQQHTKPIIRALSDNNIVSARDSVARIVSRNTDNMDAKQITSATIESSLENGCDSLFGAVFWFVIGGVPMVILYRLINTLDAMWGYRNTRFEYFGKTAARADDLLNYFPARLTALSYAIVGDYKGGIASWKNQAKSLLSPNAGPVMTAGAGSLNILLGGPAYYHQHRIDKPFFGGSDKPEIHHIKLANALIVRAVLLWCAVLLIIDTLIFFYD